MKVRLQLAFAWTCPACKRRNYHEGACTDLTPQEAEEGVREAAGLQPWEPVPEGATDGLMAEPERVVCAGCRAIYDTESMGDHDE